MALRASSCAGRTGILQPCSWDERGAVTGLCLATDTEEEFELRGPRPGDLLHLLGEVVAVRGTVLRADGHPVLDVLELRRFEDGQEPLSPAPGRRPLPEEVC